MCFHTHREHSAEQFAKEDITVYKVVLKSNTSFWRHFKYKANTLYRLRKKLKVSPIWGEIHLGFHSYSTMRKANAEVCNGTKIVAFTIPKGAKYYHNPDHMEYVSSSIRSDDLVALTYIPN